MRFCATAALRHQGHAGADAPQQAHGTRRHGTEHTRDMQRGGLRHRTRERLHMEYNNQCRDKRCQLTCECRYYPRRID